MNRRPVVAISTPALPDAVATSGLTAPPEGGDTREAAEAKCDAVTNGVVDGPTVGSVLGVGATLGCPDDLPDALPGVAGDATDLALPDALADRPDDRLSQLFPTLRLSTLSAAVGACSCLEITGHGASLAGLARPNKFGLPMPTGVCQTEVRKEWPKPQGTGGISD